MKTSVKTRLHDLLVSSGMTENELAKLAGVEYTTLHRIIRKIAKDVGIKKHLTTHVGRKTFSNLKRHEGYSVPAIAAMLGNTEETCRRHYIHAGREVIIAEMRRLGAYNDLFAA